MSHIIRFAVVGDCHYSFDKNYSVRDCLGAKKQLQRIIDILNTKQLDFVVSLGDLGDGKSEQEVPEIKQTFESCTAPVKYVIGNHDLCRRHADQHAALLGISHKPYDFIADNYRFIILNAFENSRYSKNQNDKQRYSDFCDKYTGRLFQRWPGIMSEQSYTWLENTLNSAKEQNQEVILISHVPVWHDACKRKPDENEPVARIADHIELLNLMDNYDNIRSYIAGHYHNGGTAIRKGVLHKTVRSVCDWKEPTACIFTVYNDKICVEGIGNETSITHKYKLCPSTLSGTAPEGSYVMTNCGEIQCVGNDNRFCLSVPCEGVYSIRAVKQGCKDVILPFLTAPCDNLEISFTEDKTRKLFVGETDGHAVLNITDDGKPVRWFDISGKVYGDYEPKTPMWTAHSNNFWTKSKYAFTYSGNVNIKVLPRHDYLRQHGWYKGDIHNHLFHGEAHYSGNVQQSAFIGKAEGYDWLYFSQDHGNDGSCSDYYAISEYLSDTQNLFLINDEFPKSRSNHFASLGVASSRVELDMNKVTSLEAADTYVLQRGGITVPVHPFEGHMSFRQMPLWLNCAPEKIPCMDFYYHPHYPKKYTEDYWFMLLNRGYTLGCFSTSDGAFDVGRTPGSNRGCTYVKMPSLSEQNIVEGIKQGRTMFSYDCAALMFSIDDYVSGDIIYPDNRQHNLKIKAFWQKGKFGVLRIVRNGTDIKRIPVNFSEDETAIDFEMPISEEQNCWYVALLENNEHNTVSAASPIYFRNESFTKPNVIPMPKVIPEEMFKFFEALEPDDLAKPELIDKVAQMLSELEQ